MDLKAIDRGLADQLRAEAYGMGVAYADALITEAPSDAIRGVYLKGSCIRAWETEVDYVPELSDVDIHVRLAPEAASLVASLPYALRIAEVAIANFRIRFASPAHTPRPQLFFLERIEQLPGYLPSPNGTVQTLFGEEYRAGTEAEYSNTATADAERFVADAAVVLDGLAGKVIDRPGKLLWRAVSAMTFRVAPAGPRLLSRLGMPPYEAWSLNRTSVVHELRRRGKESLAQHYASFYLAGWDGFRSAFQDDQAAGRALSAAFELFAEGVAVMDAEDTGDA